MNKQNDEQTQSRRQTLEQERAAAAWKAVKAVPSSEKSEYKTRAKNLPAMIQINGLGSTMAFLLSKPKKEAYKLVYEHLSKWLKEQLPYQEDDLMRFIQKQDVDLYRRATAEAIAYGIWLKRYVEAWGDVKEANE